MPPHICGCVTITWPNDIDIFVPSACPPHPGTSWKTNNMQSMVMRFKHYFLHLTFPLVQFVYFNTFSNPSTCRSVQVNAVLCFECKIIHQSNGKLQLLQLIRHKILREAHHALELICGSPVMSQMRVLRARANVCLCSIDKLILGTPIQAEPNLKIADYLKSQVFPNLPFWNQNNGLSMTNPTQEILLYQSQNRVIETQVTCDFRRKGGFP